MQVRLIIAKPGSCVLGEVLAPSLCDAIEALSPQRSSAGQCWAGLGGQLPGAQQPGRKPCERGVSERERVCVRV